MIHFPPITKSLLLELWKIALMLWPLWAILFGIIAIRIFSDLFFDWLHKKIDERRAHKKSLKGKAWRSDRDLLQWLRGMNPTEFEKYIADLFSRLGYKAQAVGKSHDGGIDGIAEKDGITSYIQCKKFISSTVGVQEIRDFYGALVDRLANGKGYFITTNKFTLEAEKFAEDKPIELVDGYKLVKYVRLAEKEKVS
ncbi:MAG: restriction endonuclease [bacterium]